MTTFRKIPKICYACDTTTFNRRTGKQDWSVNYLESNKMLFLCDRCYKKIIIRKKLNAATRRYYQRYPERVKESHRNLYYKNHDKSLARQKAWRQRATYKEYLENNKVKIAKTKHDYYLRKVLIGKLTQNLAN